MKNLWNSIVIWFLSFDFLVKRRAKNAMVYRHNYSEAFHKLVSNLSEYPFPSQKEKALNNVTPVPVIRKNSTCSAGIFKSKVIMEEGYPGLPKEFLVLLVDNPTNMKKFNTVVELVDLEDPKLIKSYIKVGARRVSGVRTSVILMRFNYHTMDIDNKTLQWVSGAIRKKDLPLSHILREKDLKKSIEKIEGMLERRLRT